MALLLDQLVYTSFAGMGFRLLAGEQVPTEIQEAFMERVVSQRWDSYAPPTSGYRAVYLHQVTPESNLFGWLYNDGADDMARTHVPYFICYYIAGPLHAVQLENIFTCLHKGPLALIDRHNIPATLDNIFVPNFWSYQPARPGVAIGLGVRKRSHIAQKDVMWWRRGVTRVIVEDNGKSKRDTSELGRNENDIRQADPNHVDASIS